jgi:hypothetical protein
LGFRVDAVARSDCLKKKKEKKERKKRKKERKSSVVSGLVQIPVIGRKSRDLRRLATLREFAETVEKT